MVVALLTDCWAQDTNFFTLSPKLKALLAKNPPARTALSNACATAFSGRSVGLYYFYCDNESVERAYHFYPNTMNQPAVVICVRENQYPWDELFCLLFELSNSNAQQKFAEIYEQAKAGTMSREEFPKAVLRLEFEAIKGTRDLVRGLHLSRSEKRKSHYYKLFLDCPNDFDGFLSYTKKTSKDRDPVKDYLNQYDTLRKTVSGN